MSILKCPKVQNTISLQVLLTASLRSHNTFVVRFLHCLNHISSFLTYTVYKQVISFFYTFPTFVTVHSVITANDRSNLSC